MSLIYVCVGFMAFFSATTLAIDVGMFMTARSQAQNAADAAALAGAVALALDDYDDRSASGPAVQAAVSTGIANDVIREAPSIQPADVTFPVGPGGQSNRVRVAVHRTGERMNPVSTLLGSVFGVDSVDISAAATAEAAPTMAMTCVRPFTIPDKWQERQDPSWTMDSTFDRYDSQGRVIANPDVYLPGKSGYDPEADKGQLLVIRAGTGNNVAPTMYYSWKMPEQIGASYYEENISACNTTIVSGGYIMTQEPGNMVGPTNSGVDDLIAQDPTAYWDTVEKRVKSPLGRSPRVFPIPLYDPDFFQSGKMTGRNATLRVANWIGFFVERRQGNQVYGRITPILGTHDPNAGPAPNNAFPKVIRLVE